MDSKTSNVSAVELVIFKPKRDVNEQKVQKAMESLNTIITEFDGFRNRTLAKNKDGVWMDLIFWETMEDAKSASEKIMDNEEASTAFKVIDRKEMQFYHFEPVGSNHTDE